MTTSTIIRGTNYFITELLTYSQQVILHFGVKILFFFVSHDFIMSFFKRLLDFQQFFF